MPESEPPQSKVPVYQEKSALFRVVHADGAWWSMNPKNDLHLTFYSERAPIPKVVYFGLDKEGTWNELAEERVEYIKQVTASTPEPPKQK